MKLLNFVIAAMVFIQLTPSAVIASELTLREALQRSIQSSPSLQKYPYQQRMAEAQKLQASLRPNPTVGVELENINLSGANSGVDAIQATLSFSQLVELGGKREQRLAFASAQERQINAEFQYTKISVLAETTERFYNVLRLQEIATWNQLQQKRIADALVIAEDRIKAGVAPSSELTRIRLQQSQLIADYDEIRGHLTEAITKLSAMWATEPDFVEVQGKLPQRIQLPTKAKVDTAVNEAPEYLRLLDSERLLAAKASAIESASTADLTLGFGVRYNNEFDESGLVFQASMPLQLTNPNLGVIQSNKAERELILMQQRVVREQLRMQARAIHARLQTNYTYLEDIQEQLLPLAQQLNRETRAGYMTGIHSLLVVLDAQQELAQLEYEQITRRHAMYQDILELERMTGQVFLESAL
ncbi:TolC family protein [Pseudidiomarina aestuarii]|uniref:TolC family protein n=1 Tax=Pseudidiomarina aestuarii TaxID=624146 RepID=A0A2T4D939_9GAMM|nr:TolC family protein [Pseudidiomarina aestuarii]PTB90351.1 TolC family protein [Pseudidiomarina aestuarii]